jgi:hypothetical protein
MSDLFEEEEDAVVEVSDDFVDADDEVDVRAEVTETVPNSLDARRRLEKILDEKRLLEELEDDFEDY